MRILFFTVTIAVLSVAAVILAGSLFAVRLALMVAPGVLISFVIVFAPRPSPAARTYLHFSYQTVARRKIERLTELLCKILR